MNSVLLERTEFYHGLPSSLIAATANCAQATDVLSLVPWGLTLIPMAHCTEPASC